MRSKVKGYDHPGYDDDDGVEDVNSVNNASTDIISCCFSM